MKRILFPTLLLLIVLRGNAQSCEQREEKLQTTLNSFTAGFLFNTYGLIGSIADGYVQEAYSAEQVTDLLQAQQKMAGNMSALLEKMIQEGAFSSQLTKDYIRSSVPIIRGLSAQADLFLKLVANKNKKTTAAYEAQRDSNWRELSKLMGLKE